MSPRISSVCVAFALALATGVSFAQSGGRVTTLPPMIIAGRVQKPIATVEIARVQPKITLTEIRQPFTDRIEHAVAHDPY